VSLKEIKLRDYQEPGVDGVAQSFKKGKKAPLFVMATGGGKTFCFAFITRGAMKKGKRVMILVHRSELVDQSSESLSELGVAHGLIAAKRTPDRSHRVQVASVQTLINRFADFDPPDLIITDEAHHAVAGSWAKVRQFYPKAKNLGVTATPERLDGKGLGDVFDDMVLGPQAGELIESGWLSQPLYYLIPSDADYSQVERGSNGDLNKVQLAAAIGNSSIFGCAVAQYSKVCPYVPAVAFCVNRKHAEEVTEKFKAAGFRWATLDDKVDSTTRKRIIKELGDGRLHGISTVDIVEEGFDLPVVTCAILLRKTESLKKHLQQIGRVLRPVFKKGMPLDTVAQRMLAMAKGPKPFAIILDHVGNLKHGRAEDKREWTLEGAKARKKKEAEKKGELVQLRQCPNCYAVHVPMPECPSCKHVYQPRGREIRVVEGELVPLIQGHTLDNHFTQCECGYVHAKNAKECPSCKKSDAPKDFDGGKMLQSLIKLGHRKKMANPLGWATHVYRSKISERMAKGGPVIDINKVIQSHTPTTPTPTPQQ
jgi:DNA repair protein RadD